MKPALTLLFALAAAPLLPAQDFRPAPPSVADSLVEISSRVSVFSSYELVLLRGDGSYQEIVSDGVRNSVIGFQTFPVSSGTYTYSTSQGPTGPEGTIAFSDTAELGTVSFGGGSGGIDSESVTVYPPLAATGAVNVSNNSWIEAAHPSTPGFVIQGSAPRWVLIRGAGPSLASFGVATPVAAPALAFAGSALRSVNLSTDSQNPNLGDPLPPQPVLPWSSDPNRTAGLQAMFSAAGAFQFQPGSADCAALVLLAPGAYTVQASTPGAAGELLTEVYVLPYGN
jgi:hypothetical protein